jgi:hypothetical protein
MNENNYGTPLALNLLLGFGIGSAFQGHTGGSVFGVLADSLSTILFIVGMVKISDYTIDIEEFEVRNDGYESGMNMIIAASVIVGISRIVQMINPVVYSSKYNKKLRDALNYGSVAFDVTPSVDFDGNAKVTLAISYKY